MIRFTIIILILLFSHFGFSQLYVEKQTRHRFAQMHLGVDLVSSIGGKTQFLLKEGLISSFSFTNTYTPRIIIGGTHFWGHADFQIAIPLYSSKMSDDELEVIILKGVETIFKYYPYRMENKKVRPYVGTSFAPFYFQQNNPILENEKGPEMNRTMFPLLTGFTFLSENHALEVGFSWNYRNEFDYYISSTQIETTRLPPFYMNVSYRYLFDTTISAEKDWESGRTEKITSILAEQGELNGFYIGAGLSSSFWLKKSNYNRKIRPFIEKYNPSLLPDFTLGYYLHRPDLNIAFGFRSSKTSTSTYGVKQELKRNSIVLEATKFLFDYHGFVPFLGPAISVENLSFFESYESIETIDAKMNKVGYGITFGWDIRPNKIQTWVLRTNLRWFPNLDLTIDSESSISFDNLEFNFIQLIVYPGRIF